jgi:ATPases involved in chromosome partitioning
MAQVITVAQQKGGVGPTDMVVQLAVAFAQMGKRTMVVDVPPRRAPSPDGKSFGPL